MFYNYSYAKIEIIRIITKEYNEKQTEIEIIYTKSHNKERLKQTRNLVFQPYSKANHTLASSFLQQNPM